MVVGFFFGPCTFLYTWADTSFSVDKVVSIFYMMVTPQLNPHIFTLRNEEVNSAIKHLRQKQIIS